MLQVSNMGGRIAWKQKQSLVDTDNVKGAIACMPTSACFYLLRNCIAESVVLNEWGITNELLQ